MQLEDLRLTIDEDRATIHIRFQVKRTYRTGEYFFLTKQANYGSHENFLRIDAHFRVVTKGSVPNMNRKVKMRSKFEESIKISTKHRETNQTLTRDRVRVGRLVWPTNCFVHGDYNLTINWGLILKSTKQYPIWRSICNVFSLKDNRFEYSRSPTVVTNILIDKNALTKHEREKICQFSKNQKIDRNDTDHTEQ